jgi:hypothetical protein
MSTDRAEFMALLMGLHGMMLTMSWDNKSKLRMLEAIPATVVWFSDRESLVGSVNRDFKRGTQPDLWAQLEWYEQYIDIRAVHVKRETFAWQCKTDILASEARVLIKEYDQFMVENKHI